MKGMKKGGRAMKIIMITLTIMVCGTMLFAQTQTPAGNQPSPGSTRNPDAPVPYSRDEFPDWALKLRRAEIIAAGAFPFMLFFAGFGYDSYRYAANGFDSMYLPWPLKPLNAPGLTEDERTGLLLAGVGLSIAFAAADYFLGIVFEKNVQKKGVGGTIPVLPPEPDTGSIPEQPAAESPGIQ